ncbi:MAG: hypothetical protein COB53_06055 [Elusimicrobia bacterium]|nr:MAG: hypothetical protein COB53_06055 [Elusimicrobiota bacterium]
MHVLVAGTGAALLSLDRTLIGQWMVSRPVVLGTALGWVLGDVQTGWWVGLLLEAISLDTEPVGGVIGLNGTIAVSVTLLAALGDARLPLGAAFPLGLVFGLLYRPLEEKLRRRRDGWTGLFASRLREGERAPWAKAYVTSFFEEFATAAFVLTAATFAATAAAGILWRAAPAFVRVGLEDALAISPLLAAGTLIWQLVRKERIGI